MEVKFEFIKSISRVSLEKKFSVKNFLDKFSISKKNWTKVKRLIIDRFSVFINEKLSESTFELIDKNGSSSSIMMIQLTPLLIKKSDEIYFYEQIRNIEKLAF